MATTTSHKTERDRAVSQPSRSNAVATSQSNFAAMLRDYAVQNPESAALWCFGIGFVVGWKMKFW
jgi:hypothetical protein